MPPCHPFAAACAVATLVTATPLFAQDICQGFGPQTPRDITQTAGSNTRGAPLVPDAGKLNLCNIHTHMQAEHKGPGFSVSAGSGPNGGWKCNETASLNAAVLEDSAKGHGAFHGVKPGDTIEVHWVYSSCDVKPGEGLAACSTSTCTNPQLRVEAQVFLVVNDPKALQFTDFDYSGRATGAVHQPKALPSGTGTPVIFAGSTTGDKYSQSTCSPLQVTWSVRPSCAKVDIGSLHKWAAGNAFKEQHSHGVRALVTAPELLAPIR